MVELVVVAIAAVLTAILSAVAGLGGGVVLLLVMAQFLSPTTAIPIQGAIQLVSNGARATLLRSSISWPVVGWGSLLLLPGSLLGVAIATSIPEDAVRILLAVFVLVLAWRPHWFKLSSSPEVETDAAEGEHRKQEHRPMLLGIGAVSGLLNSTVGASGPVTSPFFKSMTATHVAFVATAAAAQTAAQASKLVAFTTGGWNIADHFDLIVVGVVGVIVGSWIGTRLLGRISTELVDTIFKVVLTLLAVRLVITALS